MIILGIFQLILWELLIPTALGSLFTKADTRAKRLPMMWTSGQMLLWTLFQFICVPFILLEIDFVYFVRTYTVIVAVFLAAAFLVYRTKHIKCRREVGLIRGYCRKATATRVFWIIFALLLLLQLILAVVMTYSDGDDAYYVAVSTITNNAGTMYRKLPYTGGSTDLDARHSLAPFPIWISYLAEVSGIKAVTVAHVALPIALIAMTYAAFYLIAARLIRGEQIPVFLVFTEVLVLFGNYSYYTAENFMIARSRQGKAALGSIIIPMIIWVILVIMGQISEMRKISVQTWLLLTMILSAGCLCSTLGALICCVLVGVSGICVAITYKKWRFLIPMALCCMPCVLYALMYVLSK